MTSESGNYSRPYNFDAGEDPEGERKRLQALSRVNDQRTIAMMERIGVGSGWSCVDVGAGEGSIVRWFADRVGSDGRVVGVDLDTRYIDEIKLSNVEASKHDIMSGPVEGALFDVAHARLLLRHVENPETALQNLVASVRPGGWVAVSEADQGKDRVVTIDHPDAEFFEAQAERHREKNPRSGNTRLGRRLPLMFEEQGLETDFTVTVNYQRGGDGPGSEVRELMWKRLRDRLIRDGVTDAESFDRWTAIQQDPNFVAMIVHFDVWGRKPD